MELLGLHDYELAAERSLPREIFDHIAGAALDERTARRNISAFETLTLRPHYMRDVSRRDLTTTLLGTTVRIPVFLSPAGNKAVVHPEGDAAAARGAGRSGALMIVPARTTQAVDEVAAAAGGPLWLQVTHLGRESTAALVRAAERAGYLAICPTVDAPLLQFLERDRRNSYFAPHAAVPDAARSGAAIPECPTTLLQFTWDDLEWLRGITTLPIVLKGLTHPEDARLAVEHGAAAVFVSNHGGRWNGATQSSIESLPEIVAAVDGRIEVYLDSGIRRGSDVVKALALGARAVGIGRPVFWGLADDGADGVHRVLELLRTELDAALAFSGNVSVRELRPDLVDIPFGWGPRTLWQGGQQLR